MSERTTPARPAWCDKSVALVLQGGGALGSYQAGAYEALAERPAEGRKREVRRAMQSAPAGRRRWKLQAIENAQAMPRENSGVGRRNLSSAAANERVET